VTCSYSEPVVGWVDNLNGPTGLMVGAGKGVIRSMHCKADYNAEVMPVDITINAVIAITCNLVKNPEKWVIQSSAFNPLSLNNSMASANQSIQILILRMTFSLFSISLLCFFFILFTFIVRLYRQFVWCSKFTLCNVRDAVFDFFS